MRGKNVGFRKWKVAKEGNGDDGEERLALGFSGHEPKKAAASWVLAGWEDQWWVSWRIINKVEAPCCGNLILF